MSVRGAHATQPPPPGSPPPLSSRLSYHWHAAAWRPVAAIRTRAQAAGRLVRPRRQQRRRPRLACRTRPPCQRSGAPAEGRHCSLTPCCLHTCRSCCSCHSSKEKELKENARDGGKSFPYFPRGNGTADGRTIHMPSSCLPVFRKPRWSYSRTATQASDVQLEDCKKQGAEG